MKRKLPTDLYERALKVLEQSEILKQTVIWQGKEVDKHVREYSEERIEAMDWQEKEAAMKIADELFMRLNQSVMELKKLNDEYEKLREEAKKHFGKDVMPPVDGNIKGIIDPDDEISLL